MQQTEASEKACTRCKKTKPVDEFFRSKTMVGGRNRQCKQCHHEMHGNWVQKNKSRVKSIRHRYYLSIRNRERDERTERTKTIRTEAIQEYGGACLCCGDSFMQFLQLIFTDRDIVDGGNPYERIAKAGYPDGPFVMCANCKQAHRLGERCHTPIRQVSRVG